MPDFNAAVAFAALSFALIVVPGPSVLFVISRAVSFGRRAALLTVVGNAAGVYVQVLAVAVGLGAVVERSTMVFDAIKVLGGLYLVWLGVQAVRHRHRLASELDSAGHVRPSRSVVLEGFVVGLSNPKSTVFFAAILPQYVDRDGAPAAVQMAVLGLIFVAVALASDGAWGLAAGTARHWFARSPRRLAAIGGAGGLSLIGLGIALAFSRRSR